MKTKILNLLLILTSLIGYLEWGGGKHLFLFQAEAEIFSKLFSDPLSVLHPLIVMPLIAQVLLLITLFRSKPSKLLTYISIGCLGLLLGLMFLIGIMSLNFKMILSVAPFITVSVLTIIHYRRIKKGENEE
jgi:hypothetical protein